MKKSSIERLLPRPHLDPDFQALHPARPAQTTRTARSAPSRRMHERRNHSHKLLYTAVGLVAVVAVGGGYAETAFHAVNAANTLPGKITTNAEFPDPPNQPIAGMAQFEISPKLITQIPNSSDIGVGLLMFIDKKDFPRIAKKNENPLAVTYGEYNAILCSAKNPALFAAGVKDDAMLIDTVKNRATAFVTAGALANEPNVTAAAKATELHTYENGYEVYPYTAVPDNPQIPNLYLYYQDPSQGNRIVQCLPVK